jgi:hypothetical protein
MLKRFLFLFILASLFLSGQTVAALSPEQRKVFDSGISEFLVKETVCIGSSNSGAGGPLLGPRFPSGVNEGELVQKIRDYITNTRPDSPLIAHAEDFVSYGKQFDVNPAFIVALAQKESSLATAGAARPPQYNVFSIRNGAQGSFGNYAGYADAIRAVNELIASELYLGPPANFTTIDEIMNRYAPPSENDTEGYIAFIKDVMQRIFGSSSVSGTPTQAVAGCLGSSTGVVSAEGYSFPIGPQKKSEISAGYPLPCNAACHHDGTYAFDFSNSSNDDEAAGRPVFAISDGEVDQVGIYNNIPGCYSLQLLSSKDHYWYWYGHIQNPRVQSGDRVAAGTQIAEIGVRDCTGNGSYPHLHIDRGCVADGVPQKGGRDSCRDSGINNVINALWATLPA